MKEMKKEEDEESIVILCNKPYNYEFHYNAKLFIILIRKLIVDNSESNNLSSQPPTAPGLDPNPN